MEPEDSEVWVNLAEWDNLENPLAPLSEEEQKSILFLAALCDHKLTIQDVSLILSLFTCVLAPLRLLLCNTGNNQLDNP